MKKQYIEPILNEWQLTGQSLMNGVSTGGGSDAPVIGVGDKIPAGEATAPLRHIPALRPAFK